MTTTGNLLTEVNKKFSFRLGGKFLICLIKKTWALLSLSRAPRSPSESLTGSPTTFPFCQVYLESWSCCCREDVVS